MPSLVGFGAAAKEAYSSLGENIARMDGLRERLAEGLRSVPGVELIHADGAVASFAVPKYPSEVIIRMLERRGVFVSGGSACARGRSSHVLEAMKLDRKLVASAVRASVSWTNSEEDVDALIEGLKNL